jgi:hypothetical protein
MYRYETAVEGGMSSRARVLERSLYSERYCFVQVQYMYRGLD